jgi:DNA repair ATPase RecN
MSTKIPIIRKDGQEKTPSVTVVLLAKDTLKKLAKLNDSIELYSDLDDEKTIKYFSDLYEEMFSRLKTIVTYLVENQYAGIDNRIDAEVLKLENFLGAIKPLHEKYENLKNGSRKVEFDNKEKFDSIKEKLGDLRLLASKYNVTKK